MKSAALVVAAGTIAIGTVGLIAPGRLTALRRIYFATPAGLFAAAVIRASMGIAVIASARRSAAPGTLRVFGGLMCMQAVTGTLLGPARARAVLEWEAMLRTEFLRAGAAVALGSGVFIAAAVLAHRPSQGPAHGSSPTSSEQTAR